MSLHNAFKETETAMIDTDAIYYLGYCLKNGVMAFGECAGNPDVAGLNCITQHEVKQSFVKKVRFEGKPSNLEITVLQNVGWYNENGACATPFDSLEVKQ